MDVLRYLGAVTREVQKRDHAGRPARAIVATCTYDTTVDDVWDAITNPERIPRWFLPISGDLRFKGRYQLLGNAGGEIMACEPPRNLAVTWEFGGQISWVHVSLTELSDGGTRLQLEHIVAMPDDTWSQYGPGAIGVGWDLTLMGLGRHLSKETAAWLASEEGKDFVRQSSEAWGRASIDAGTDQARRTTAFYLGV
jgi:uncharacterized protein YndB with AHSA1/START domain